MTYRIRVEHASRYIYAHTVQSSYNEARISPLTTPWQLVLDSRIDVRPAANVQAYVDYWGTVVHAFDLQQPHEEMAITARSVVETTRGPIVSGDDDWLDLLEGPAADTFAEYLAPTSQVPSDERLQEIGLGLARGCTPCEAANNAVSWVAEQLSYVPGATAVHTSAIEAWEGGEGVCQDFAHLSLAVLRAMGIPARYCSGYMHPDGEAHLGETTRGESHAWIEFWSGRWYPVDPTAGRSTSERHVLVARGRDYSDVPPIKGIFHGGPTDHLEVSVSLTRLA
ncbi:MAG: transglutaminase family protein [Acidimicrobiales bacterium]|nr:transglutaminase family protein [Acidimicrobiales bacterium]